MKGDFKMDMEKIRNNGQKEEHEQPKEDQPSALMEKIQQLGQTNVPQLITGFKDPLLNDNWPS